MLQGVGHRGKRFCLTLTKLNKCSMTQQSQSWVFTQEKGERAPHIHTETCTRVFVAVSSTVSKLWKQPRCPSTGKWTKQLWHARTTDCCLTLKMKELWICPAAQTNRKTILLGGEARPKKNRTFCMLPFIEKSRKCKLICSDRKQVSGCLGMGWGGVGRERRGNYRGALETLGGRQSVYFLDGGDGFAGVHI